LKDGYNNKVELVDSPGITPSCIAMQVATEDTSGDRSNKGDIDFKNILLSPVTSVASWLHHHPEKQVPALEEASPQLAGDSVLAPSEEDDFDDDYFTASPKASESSPSENKFDLGREITNFFSPTPVKKEPTITNRVESSTPAPPTERMASPQKNQFDPIRNIVDFFSPTPKKEESPGGTVEQTVPPAGLRLRFGQTPGKQQTQKRLDFDDVAIDERATCAPAAREVATVQELYTDGRKALERMMASAKEADVQEYWGKARQFDTKELVEKARSTARRTVKKVEGEVTRIVDSAKEVEPKVVLEHAQASAKEAAEAIRSNAQVHPRAWAIIGAISFAILVQYLFLSGSVGTPSMRWWRFSVQVHRSKTTGSIAERVGNFLQIEMGEAEADEIMLRAKSTPTNAGVLGQDILSRLAASLEDPVDNKPDIVDLVRDKIDLVRDKIDMVRENPPHHYNMALSGSRTVVVNMWKQANQLTTEAFDEITAL
jgi:hypothetical protein